MAFSALTTLETTYKKPIRQALMRKIKDNFDDHESRLVKLERGGRIFDHFNFNDVQNTKVVDSTLWADPATLTFTAPAFSVLALAFTNTFEAPFLSKRALQFDSVTLPIIYTMRVKKLVDSNTHYGLIVHTGAYGDRNGIWLERVDATNWRFVSYNGSRNNGSNFAKATDGNWFIVQIEFTNDGANKALCRVDGVLKDTLTTQLPTTSALFAYQQQVGAGTGTPHMRIDYIDLTCASFNDAA